MYPALRNESSLEIFTEQDPPLQVKTELRSPLILLAGTLLSFRMDFFTALDFNLTSSILDTQVSDFLSLLACGGHSRDICGTSALF